MGQEFESFTKIRQISDALDGRTIILPNEVALGIKDAAEGQRMREIAYELWNTVFQERYLAETLTAIESGPAQNSSEVNSNLKMTRIVGVVFRDANCLFSESHMAPFDLYNFVRTLGMFNDNFGTNVSEPSIDNLLETMKKSRDAMADYIFVPCSPDSHKDYVQEQFNLISGYLGQKELPRELLHDLRRTNRHILNLLLLKALDNMEPKSAELYAYLRQANTVLGIFLDENKIDPVIGKVIEDERPVKIPVLASELITNFMERVSWSD
jgi:hypothetical protein